MKPALVALLALVSLAASGARAADEAAALLIQRCAGCHNLTGPAPHTLKELWARKAPDLFYAGNKFRAEWLRAWLQKPSRIRVAGESFAIAEGETIHTENSYKYTVDGFRALAVEAGFRPRAAWRDPHALFSLHWLEA